MYSFYGGKEGRSFTIKDRFDSVNDMTAAFALGGAYNTTGYNEFVIIDTPNKASYENGCVYRRGFDYDTIRNTAAPAIDDTHVITVTQGALSAKVTARIYWNDIYTLSGTVGAVVVTVTYGDFNQELFDDAVLAYIKSPGAGAEYVGQIVGPEGGAAAVSLVDWSIFNNVYPSAADGERDDSVELERSSGKTTDVTKAGYCTLRDERGRVTHAYLAFDFPYDVFEMRAESASPYGPTIKTVTTLPSIGEEEVYYKVGTKYYLYENSTWIERQPWSVASRTGTDGPIYYYRNLIRERQESEGHPFYFSYDIKVPKGIHGKSIEEVGINLTGARLDNGDVDQSNHNYEWYFEQRNFDQSEDGVRTRTYLGDFNKVIDRITTNIGNPDNVYEKVKRSTAYRVGDYALIEGKSDVILLCAKDGITNSATTFDLSEVSEGYQFVDGTVIWLVVDKISIPPSLATVHFTHGDNENFDIRLLQSLELDYDGRMYAKYSDITHRSYVGDSRSIIGVGYNPDPRVARFYIKYNTYYRTPGGVIEPHSTFTYNEDDTDVVVFPFTDIEGREIEYINEKIRFIASVTVDPDTKNFIVTYNTGEKVVLDVYKVIDHVSIDTNTKELIITYNTGEKDVLDVIKVIDKASIDSISKRLVIDYNTGEKDELLVMRTIQRLYWNDDYKLVAVYNAADPDNDQPIEQVLDDGYEMKYVEKIYISNDGDLTKEQYYESDFVIGKDEDSDDGLKHEIKRISVKPINDVVAIRLMGDNIMVLYSNPTYRDTLTNYYETDYEGETYKWANLGPILGGNHIIGNFATIEELKERYPYGFGKDTTGATDETTQNRMGWIATVGNASEGYKFYAYDYMAAAASPDNWYLIQEIGAEAIDPQYSIIVAKKEVSGIPVDNLDSILNIHGVWFVVSEG